MRIAVADDELKEIGSFRTIINEYARIKQLDLDLGCFSGAEDQKGRVIYD